MKKSILLSIVLMLVLSIPSVGFAGVGGPTSYSYSTYNAKNGLTLNIIQTTPENIKFETLSKGKSLTNSSFYGINGGYFTPAGRTLHIAVKNDKPITGVGSDGGKGGNGWYNHYETKGEKGTSTVVWDGDKRSFSIQKVWDAGSISVKNRKNYWAQGGFGMHLGNSNWRKLAEDEGLTGSTSPAMGRTALVYHKSSVYLIVTNVPEEDKKTDNKKNHHTHSQFRDAVQQYFNITDGSSSSSVNGVFLDGSGSSQMKAISNTNKVVNVTGDGRQLVQIISLINQ
ncbi:hypothetical protein [Paenibacillus alvei]|uniref:hypothetical protein n=1 Tax=Paenibacillus alvei TaxID=44250 RepID=UPI0003858E10|nr:hypothetical protein [Paenibacillus alvei]EPY13685.1 hypothetical protein PAAL66ix_06633 [Paenibacillus alvei A6-6i-x]